MPTALELAQQREARKLRQHNLDPDTGRPANDGGDADDDAPINLGSDADDDDDLLGDDPPARGGGGNLEQELAELRRQLAALTGRVGPAQAQVEEYRGMLRAEQERRERERNDLQAQIQALQEQLEERNASAPLDLESVLSEDERRDIDPLVLNAAVKIAEAMAKRTMPKVNVKAEALSVIQEREAQRVVQYRTKVLTDSTRGLHQLAQLAYDPEFIAWSKEDDNDVDSVVTSLMSAQSTEEIDRYAKIVAKRINAFKNRKKATSTDARPSLGGYMRRGERPRLTESEIQDKINEAKQLARSRNPADRKRAEQILNDLK